MCESVWHGMRMGQGKVASRAAGDSTDHTIFAKDGREYLYLRFTLGFLFSYRGQRPF